ncbi:MAG: thiamine pyrophosphate-binding protein [Oscillospiraceae bacterium]
MKVSDYIVEYLIEKGITHVFGYPGGMVTHLMDSFSKYGDRISAHVTYHEQGAAFAACGYAQASGKVGVAYATSGPGATNLLTGVCNAFFDSIPTLFITGQVNTFEQKGQYGVRQRGFQETDIVSMAASVTKYAAKINSADEVKWHLDYAFHVAQSGRKGPVLLDIPMNIFRAEIDPDGLGSYNPLEQKVSASEDCYAVLAENLAKAKRPVLLLGNGIKSANATECVQQLLREVKIPTVSTMIAVDVVAGSELNYGFIGAYGSRTANFIVAKSDLVITLGARLDVRQVGAKRENFAPEATIVRIDVDGGELEYKVRDNEIQIQADVAQVVDILGRAVKNCEGEYSQWIRVCDMIREKLSGMDDRLPNRLTKTLSRFVPENTVMTTDVGQNQVWIAQSFDMKKGQKVFFSGGHGAMGYSLPAAIGCCLAQKNPVYSFNGDGGIQMNLQELQVIVREQLPVKIVIYNNNALGMIRHFQEMYFQDNYYQTVPAGGYTAPDFEKIAKAYGLDYFCVETEEDMDEHMFSGSKPCVIELKIRENTYVFPKLEFGKPNQDQEPLLDRQLFEELMTL